MRQACHRHRRLGSISLRAFPSPSLFRIDECCRWRASDPTSNHIQQQLDGPSSAAIRANSENGRGDIAAGRFARLFVLFGNTFSYPPKVALPKDAARSLLHSASTSFTRLHYVAAQLCETIRLNKTAVFGFASNKAVHVEPPPSKSTDTASEDTQSDVSGGQASLPDDLVSFLSSLQASDKDIAKMLSRRKRIASSDFPHLQALLRILRSYGMSDAEILRAATYMPAWLTRPPDEVKQVLEALLTVGGVRQSRLSSVVRKNPQVLTADPFTLRFKLSSLSDPNLGLPAVGSLIESCPRVLNMKLATLVDRMAALKHELGPDKASRLILRTPQCLMRTWAQHSSRIAALASVCRSQGSLDHSMRVSAASLRPKVALMAAVVGEERAGRLFAHHPRLMSVSLGALRGRWEGLVALLGEAVARKTVRYFPDVLGVRHEVVREALEEWRRQQPGVTGEEVARHGTLLAYNWKTSVVPKIEFLEAFFGLPRSEIDISPGVLTRSLDPCIRPRLTALRDAGVAVLPNAARSQHQIQVWGSREKRLRQWGEVRAQLEAAGRRKSEGTGGNQIDERGRVGLSYGQGGEEGELHPQVGLSVLRLPEKQFKEVLEDARHFFKKDLQA